MDAEDAMLRNDSTPHREALHTRNVYDGTIIVVPQPRICISSWRALAESYLKRLLNDGASKVRISSIMPNGIVTLLRLSGTSVIHRDPARHVYFSKVSIKTGVFTSQHVVIPIVWGLQTSALSWRKSGEI
jgi:hypothetical protein